MGSDSSPESRLLAPESSDVSPPGGWLRLEVDEGALRHNMARFRRLVQPPARLLGVVKANGYGHGLLRAGRAFLGGGADALGVHTVAEARALRHGGVSAPLLVLGPSHQEGLREASGLRVEVTVGSLEAAVLAASVARAGSPLRVHLKVETGVYRQGVAVAEIPRALELLEAPNLRLVGLSSHFADIEDTTDHTFADLQQERFARCCQELAARGHRDLCRHMSCSAAVLLWPSTHWDMARVGISGYGIWPSRETLVSVRAAGAAPPDLRPAVAWKCAIAQVKTVQAGETVGYGRSWKAQVATRLAVLPVGYADGYPRALSGRAEVLVRGRRAPLRGRICMNMCMIDVTNVPGAAAGDEVVLLGRQGQEEIRAEDVAGLLGTIPYEVLTLPGATWERVSV
jgi:alanine racemase